PLEARPAGPLGLRVALVVVPALGRDEDLCAIESRGAYRLTDGRLVGICGGRVQMAIADRQRRRHHLLGLARRHLKDPEAELRDLLVRRQRKPWDLIGLGAHALLNAHYA